MRSHLGACLLSAALGGILVFGLTARSPEARAAAAEPKAECAQWELTLGPSVTMRAGTTKVTVATELAVEQAPAGWEPFAYLPTGQVSYRRCAK